MSNKLDEARTIINEIDKQMIELYIKRMKAVKMVAEYKLENGLQVLDESREEFLKAKNLKELDDKMLEKYYLEFFEGVLESSKDFQRELIAKYNGKK
ncbi:MAG: chorismate mutase [Acholeplasmatales bacterium]|nr:chorismate mutase [Acholeplasmatales bacterium]